MATNHEIQNGLDPSELDIGTGRINSRKEVATLKMGFSVQICSRLGKAEIQSTARREGIQTRTWGRLRRNILTRSQDDHSSAPTRGRGNRRPRARAIGCKNDIPTRRLGRGHPHVPTSWLLGDGGGISPRMSIEEKSHIET